MNLANLFAIVVCSSLTILHSKTAAADNSRCPIRLVEINATCEHVSTCPECSVGAACCPRNDGCGFECVQVFPVDPQLPEVPICLKGEEKSVCEENPCGLDSCPNFPNATCSKSRCGACQAVFTEDGEVIPKFACSFLSEWPDCLQLIRCNFFEKCLTQCPAIPEAECNPNCNCDAVFTHPATGRVFSEFECNRKCPPDNPPVECDVDPCDEESCPGRPEATCVNYNCGGCHAVFVDPLGEVIPKFSCLFNANYPACLALIFCPSIRETCETSCPRVPSAQCFQNCQCGAVFTDRYTGNVLSEVQCREPGDCPEDRPEVQCAATPCGEESCPGRPDATCTNVYCGECKAVFHDSQGIIIPKFACPATSPADRWPRCLQLVRCGQPNRPCKTGCPGVPDADCSLNCGCQNSFTDRMTGDILSDEQCFASDRLCDPLIDPDDNPRDLILTCTNKRSVGSRCTVTCDPGSQVHGISRTECMANGQWSDTLMQTACVPFRSVCPPGVPEVSCVIPPCDAARCPNIPLATCVETRCGECGFQFIAPNDLPATRRNCLPPQDCWLRFLFDFSHCRNKCKGASCAGHPDALCRVNCFCRARFYDPITLRQVKCTNSGFPFFS